MIFKLKPYIDLFVTFFKIGITTFGAGYAMIAMMNREIAEKRKWCSEQEFIDYLAIAQSSPGPMAVNTALMVGYHCKKWKGLLLAGFATILPSFVVLLVISVFFTQFSHYELVKDIFKGMRPAVVALILYPVFNFAKHLKKPEYPLFIAIAVLIYLGVSPIIFIILAIVFGIYRAYNLVQNNKK